MQGAPLSAAAAGALIAATLLAGCASQSEDRTAGWSPNRIYAEANDEMTSNSYDKAIPLYETLEGRAAGTPLAQQAQLDKAYAQYKDDQKPEAVATLDRFMRLHPTSPAMDYALYLKGVVNFNGNLGMFSFLTRQDLSERDQKAAKEAFQSFDELVKRFPDSRYTPDARARMRYIVNSLARYDVHVARFYYSRGAYVAAIDRAQEAIKDYRDAPALQEALYILVESYDKLGMTQLRDDAKRVLDQNYPNSAYLAKGFTTTTDKPWWRLW
ncbi:MAG: outer membrane protein assembly factor BamD [Burkholderiaceae bacterium]|jgi:outer membrane protein assembly factor BamD|nr:MAG: outer membrane protein assembly factor BamD [Burkholderiaceae bacterium]